MASRPVQIALFVFSLSLLDGVSDAQCNVTSSDSQISAFIGTSACDSFMVQLTSTLGSVKMVAYIRAAELAADNFCEVYEGADTSGNLAGILQGGGPSFPVVLTGPNVFVHCVSNYTTETLNFRILQANLCGGETTGPVFNFMSPNFPSDYPTNQVCTWNFHFDTRKSLLFQFSAFYLQLTYDTLFFKIDNNRVEIVNGSFQGFQHRVNATNLTAMFLSDTNNNRMGFNATVVLDEVMPQAVECREKDLTITVTADEQMTLDYELGDTLYIALNRETSLSQLNNSCKVTGSDPVFVFDIGQCEAFYKNGNGMVSVSFLIWRYLAPTSAVIQRDVQNKLNVTCLFESEILLSSSNVQPHAGSAEISAQNTGNFDVALNLFTNEHFNESLPGEVIVPNCIFAEVRLNDVSVSNHDYIVQLEECFATRVENSSGLPNYPVVQSGCVAPPSGDEAADAKILMRNYKSNFATFKLKSFVWTNFTNAEQFIYIHCDVTICQNSTGQCPGQTCGGVGRRSVDNNGRNQRLSAGPVHIIQTPKYLLVQDTKQDNDGINEAADNILTLVMFVLLAAVIIGAGYFIWVKLAQDPKAKQIRL